MWILKDIKIEYFSHDEGEGKLHQHNSFETVLSPDKKRVYTIRPNKTGFSVKIDTYIRIAGEVPKPLDFSDFTF